MILNSYKNLNKYCIQKFTAGCRRMELRKNSRTCNHRTDSRWSLIGRLILLCACAHTQSNSLSGSWKRHKNSFLIQIYSKIFVGACLGNLVSLQEVEDNLREESMNVFWGNTKLRQCNNGLQNIRTLSETTRQKRFSIQAHECMSVMAFKWMGMVNLHIFDLHHLLRVRLHTLYKCKINETCWTIKSRHYNSWVTQDIQGRRSILEKAWLRPEALPVWCSGCPIIASNPIKLRQRQIDTQCPCFGWYTLHLQSNSYDIVFVMQTQNRSSSSLLSSHSQIWAYLNCMM